MLVREIMSNPAVTTSSASGVDHASTLLRSHGFTALPVLDDGGRLIGIISEADILQGRSARDDRRPGAAGLPRRRNPDDTVGEVMTAPVEFLTPDADVGDAARIMRDERIRCIPVVDGRSVIGVITQRDLLGVATSPVGRGRGVTASCQGR